MVIWMGMDKDLERILMGSKGLWDRDLDRDLDRDGYGFG